MTPENVQLTKDCVQETLHVTHVTFTNICTGQVTTIANSPIEIFLFGLFVMGLLAVVLFIWYMLADVMGFTS